MSPVPELVAPFAALAALLPDFPCKVEEATVSFLERLDASEASALREFEAAGKRCISQLGEETLSTLRESSTRRGGAQHAAKAKEEELPEKGSVRLMFEKFDTDGDGLISRKDFKDALLQVGLGEHLADFELDELVEMADKNHDRFVNLQEFTEWLFASGLNTSGGEEEREEPPPSPPPEKESEREESDEDREEKDRDHLRELKELRKELAKAQAEVEAAKAKAEEEEREVRASKRRTEAELSRREEIFELERDDILAFWRQVAQHSAAEILDRTVDLDAADLLGNGKYGFVLRSKRVIDKRPVVVKLLGLRWAHVACKEWSISQICLHPNIVHYEGVLVHADSSKLISGLLQAAQEAGKMTLRTKRTEFPDRWICLTQEFMNRGSVQDWMNQERLYPGGLLSVMQAVACALAHMHKAGTTHNDIKPENVLLLQQDEADPRAPVSVKLADLGLADRSMERANDRAQFGMTALCMATGERFGSRKFLRENIEEFVAGVATLTGDSGKKRSKPGCPVTEALSEVPAILRGVWEDSVSMAEVRDWPCLQNRSFFEGGPD
mmetsp:Transcript_35197/g.76868  ORF Transcript_35197/g.76868 Transcript_35197/m.76868 type:complete len:556 (+) Transcript_35197:82-1749(+)